MKYEYTMKNLKKHIGFNLKENYTDKEVKRLLDIVFSILDKEASKFCEERMLEYIRAYDRARINQAFKDCGGNK